MPDMDVIVKSLRRCSDMTICPDDCSYRKYAPDCAAKLHKDAIDLLKEQNELLKQQAEMLEEQGAKTGHWISVDDGDVVAIDNDGCPERACYCSECQKYLDLSEEYAVHGIYCPVCGAKMEGR